MEDPTQGVVKIAGSGAQRRNDVIFCERDWFYMVTIHGGDRWTCGTEQGLGHLIQSLGGGACVRVQFVRGDEVDKIQNGINK